MDCDKVTKLDPKNKRVFDLRVYRRNLEKTDLGFVTLSHCSGENLPMDRSTPLPAVSLGAGSCCHSPHGCVFSHLRVCHRAGCGSVIGHPCRTSILGIPAARLDAMTGGGWRWSAFFAPNAEMSELKRNRVEFLGRRAA
jgi:hypothetical protein